MTTGERALLIARFQRILTHTVSEGDIMAMAKQSERSSDPPSNGYAFAFGYASACLDTIREIASKGIELLNKANIKETLDRVS